MGHDASFVDRRRRGRARWNRSGGGKKAAGLSRRPQLHSRNPERAFPLSTIARDDAPPPATAAAGSLEAKDVAKPNPNPDDQLSASLVMAIDNLDKGSE